MRLLSRCAVGALALLLLAFAVPGSASAAGSGGGHFQAGAAGGGSYSKVKPVDGYRWRERPVERPGFPGVRVPCDGTEPEATDGTIPKGLYNYVLDRSAQEGYVAQFFRKFETYQQRTTAPFDVLPGTGRDHCKLDLDVQWNRVSAKLVERSGLAGTWMRQDVTLDAPSIQFWVPSYDGTPGWWFRGTATAESAAWQSPGDTCPLRNATSTTVEVQIMKKTCPLDVSITWSFGAERSASPDGPWETIVAGEGQTLTLEPTTELYPANITGLEARIGYTDGSTSSANGSTTRESVEILRSRSAIEGFQTKVVDPNTGKLVDAATLGAQHELDAQGRPIVTENDTPQVTTPNNPTPNSKTTKRTAAGGTSPQSRLLTVGGFGLGFVLLAVAAVCGLLYFGRRHRL